MKFPAKHLRDSRRKNKGTGDLKYKTHIIMLFRQIMDLPLNLILIFYLAEFCGYLFRTVCMCGLQKAHNGLQLKPTLQKRTGNQKKGKTVFLIEEA